MQEFYLKVSEIRGPGDETGRSLYAQFSRSRLPLLGEMFDVEGDYEEIAFVWNKQFASGVDVMVEVQMRNAHFEHLLESGRWIAGGPE